MKIIFTIQNPIYDDRLYIIKEQIMEYQFKYSIDLIVTGVCIK